MTIQASVLAADEVTFSVNGKLNVFGIYAHDIVIPQQFHVISQLVYLFIVEGDASDSPKSLRLEITSPGQGVRYQDIELPPNRISLPPHRTRWTIQVPVLISPAIMQPGKVIARVYIDGQPIEIPGPWVVLLPTASQQPS